VEEPKRKRRGGKGPGKDQVLRGGKRRGGEKVLFFRAPFIAKELMGMSHSGMAMHGSEPTCPNS